LSESLEARRARTAAATRARWAGSTPEQRKAQTAAMRRAQAFQTIREQVQESRKAQGLPPTVTDDQILMELAREVLGGGRDEAA
jgi:hypothetical protein